MSDLAAKLSAQREQNKGEKPMPVEDGFAKDADLMTRTNIYLPTATLDALKQRALDEKKTQDGRKATSVSALILEAVTSGWSLNEPVRRPKPKQAWESPDYDL